MVLAARCLLVCSVLILACYSCAGEDSAAGTPTGAQSSCGVGEVSCPSGCVVGATCPAPSPTGTGGAAAATAATTPAPAPTPAAVSPSEYCPDVGVNSGTLSTQFASATLVAGGGKSYRLMTNWWGVFDGQAVEYDGLSFTVRNPKNVTSSQPGRNANYPIGYPTLFIGSYQGTPASGSNLPKQVSELTTVRTDLRSNGADMGRTDYNVAYDVWFTPTASPLDSAASAPPAGGAYLMVWLFDPTNRQPRGVNQRPGQSLAGVPGQWDVWVDSTNPPCISYVSRTPLNDLEFDLNLFIRDAVTHRHGITDSMYLSIIFAGAEVWGGSDGVAIENFCAIVD